MNVEVSSVEVKPGSLFSKGIGKDKDGRLVRFIGHTSDIHRVNEALKKLDGPVEVTLEAWQYAGQNHN